MKIRPVGPKMFHADKWADMMNHRFSQFCKHV